MVLGGLSVKISCQSEHYVQRYSNSNGAMLLKEWHFNCVTLMSRFVCLFITNKILGIHSKFFLWGSICEGSELNSKFIIETSDPEKGLKEKMITGLVAYQQVAFRKGLSGGAIKR